MNHQVIIIGGGLAGLVCAFYLKRANVDVKLFEASANTGGKIASQQVGGERFDVGPNTVLESNESIARLIDDLHLRERMIFADAASNARFVLKHGAPVVMPASPQTFLTTPLFSGLAKLRLLREPFIGISAREETLAEFCERRFGREVLDYALDPFLIGTYAARAEDLSADACLKLLRELEQAHGSVIKGFFKRAKENRGVKKNYSGKMFSFEHGFSEVMTSLRNELGQAVLTEAQVNTLEATGQPANGVRVRYTHQGDTFEASASTVVIAAQADSAAYLIEGVDVKLAATLRQIKSSPVAQVFLVYDRNEVASPQGFGLLVPSKEQQEILGVVFNSRIFPARYQQTVFTVFIGGSRQPELARQTDDDLKSLAGRGLAATLGITAQPIDAAVAKWPDAIPQYGLGYNHILQTVSDFESHTKNIFFTGNWRSGISVPDTIAHAHTVAEKILNALIND